VILVTSEHKRSIEDHFDSATDLEAVLEARGDIEHLRAVRAVADMVRLVTVRQKAQLGLGHAVLMARDAVGREPFAVVLPDDLIIGGEPALGELIKAFEASSASGVALMEVAADQTRRYGIVEPDPTLPSSDGGRIIPLRGLVEKPEPADAPSNLAIVGRYVLSPKIFETLERTQHGAGGEIQLTDAIQCAPNLRHKLARGTRNAHSGRGEVSGTSEVRLKAGDLVAARYRLQEQIGEGAAASVFRATDEVLGRDVAVKVLRGALAASPDATARFRAEGRAAAIIAHPNVAAVFDVTPEGDAPAIIMEFVDGEDLASMLRRVGPLVPRRAAAIAAQVARGLAAAHQRGIIHRDVSSRNILIGREGRAQIADFGIAHAILEDGLPTGTKGSAAPPGTAHYVAPEVAAGAPATASSDLYGLGVVLFELLTGRRPALRGADDAVPSPRTLRPDSRCVGVVCGQSWANINSAASGWPCGGCAARTRWYARGACCGGGGTR